MIGFKNNKLLISWIIISAFLVAVVYFDNKRDEKNRAINSRQKTAVARTTGCNINVRSAAPWVNYVFTVNEMHYRGATQFNRDKRGDICSDKFFLVKYDSSHPERNNILLDSPVLQPER